MMRLAFQLQCSDGAICYSNGGGCDRVLQQLHGVRLASLRFISCFHEIVQMPDNIYTVSVQGNSVHCMDLLYSQRRRQLWGTGARAPSTLHVYGYAYKVPNYNCVYLSHIGGRAATGMTLGSILPHCWVS